ncbi:hypothetical protein [Mycolicibacterium phocaicum]|uniref:hypothetical protein n=1 Tax=Mycolicibacterium phocaicum TaxID=319706 RepID=UPI0013D6D08C|nr:hypothetical protein [Mycolicibacterium phocaicum]
MWRHGARIVGGLHQGVGRGELVGGGGPLGAVVVVVVVVVVVGALVNVVDVGIGPEVVGGGV